MAKTKKVVAVLTAAEHAILKTKAAKSRRTLGRQLASMAFEKEEAA